MGLKQQTSVLGLKEWQEASSVSKVDTEEVRTECSPHPPGLPVPLFRLNVPR